VSPTNKLISEMRDHAGLWSRDVGKAESHEREILVRAYELCLWAEEDRNNDMIVKGLIVAAGIQSSTRKSHKCPSGSGRSMPRGDRGAVPAYRQRSERLLS
jgi:hypothetical protein